MKLLQLNLLLLGGSIARGLGGAHVERHNDGRLFEEIPFESDGNLSLTRDPKEAWAARHPERFPVDVNRADKFELLRVPGLGPISVNRILARRTNGGRIRRLSDLGSVGKRLHKAAAYIKFGY